MLWHVVRTRRKVFGNAAPFRLLVNTVTPHVTPSGKKKRGLILSSTAVCEVDTGEQP